MLYVFPTLKTSELGLSTTQSDHLSPSEELNRSLQHLHVDTETDCKHVANNMLKLKNVINTHHCLDLVTIDCLYKQTLSTDTFNAGLTLIQSEKTNIMPVNTLLGFLL